MNGAAASRYEQQVSGVLAATEVRSDGSYSWFGHPISVLPEGMPAQSGRAYLLHALQQQLYVDFYCRGGRAAPSHAVSESTPAVLYATPFVRALCAANAGRGPCEGAWRIRTLDGESVVVERKGLHLWVAPCDILTLGGKAPAIGAWAAVRLPKELLHYSPGFYLALGDEPLQPVQPREREPLVRLYWNLTSEAVPRLIEDATARLNRARIGFRLKVVNEPGRYTRCDAGILYVSRRHYQQVIAPMIEVYERLSNGLRPQVPAFTKQLAPGLGLAEGPGDGESFGMHRCKLLADGVIRGQELGFGSIDERLRIVAARFEEEGIGLDAPFLNPGSSDQYSPWPLR
jgi:hypothetical protein